MPIAISQAGIALPVVASGPVVTQQNSLARQPDALPPPHTPTQPLQVEPSVLSPPPTPIQPVRVEATLHWSNRHAKVCPPDCPPGLPYRLFDFHICDVCEHCRVCPFRLLSYFDRRCCSQPSCPAPANEQAQQQPTKPSAFAQQPSKPSAFRPHSSKSKSSVASCSSLCRCCRSSC